MFSKHVTKSLSAYCHGEVAAAESRRIAEHLIGCNRCRGQFEEIKLGVKLAERLPQLAAPDSLLVLQQDWFYPPFWVPGCSTRASRAHFGKWLGSMGRQELARRAWTQKAGSPSANGWRLTVLLAQRLKSVLLAMWRSIPTREYD